MNKNKKSGASIWDKLSEDEKYSKFLKQMEEIENDPYQKQYEKELAALTENDDRIFPDYAGQYPLNDEVQVTPRIHLEDVVKRRAIAKDINDARYTPDFYLGEGPGKKPPRSRTPLLKIRSLQDLLDVRSGKKYLVYPPERDDY